MRRTITLSLIAVVVASLPAWAAQHEVFSPEKIQQAMMAAAMPGEQHRYLAKMAGEFTYTAKAWVQPGAAVMEWTGNRSGKMILGGRYLEEHVDGTFQGMPFEGMGLWAYDNMAKHYIYTWVNNMSTTVTQATGSRGEKGWELEGTHTVPGMGAENAFKTVLRTVDEDTFVFEWYEALPGRDEMFKMMEITYKRK